LNAEREGRYPQVGASKVPEYGGRRDTDREPKKEKEKMIHSQFLSVWVEKNSLFSKHQIATSGVVLPLGSG